MWCTKREVNPVERVSSPNNVANKELRQSEFIEPSPVNDFIFQEHEVDGVVSVRCSSDIYMLFNQQRLDRMSRESLVKYFGELSVTEPKMKELRSKLSDDQLCSFVKSRFVQTPGELMAWSQYLMSSQDKMVAAAAAELQAAPPTAHTVDPTVEP